MKKFLPYGIFSLIALVISIILSELLDFSLSNTWQALLALVFVFGALWVYGWKQTSVHKRNHPFISFIGRWCLIMLVIGYIISALLILSGLAVTPG